MRLQKGHQQIKDAELQLVGISFDGVEALSRFSKSQKIKFPLLSDPKSKVIKQFGLLNTSVREGTFKFGIAYPRTVIIDKSGTVLSSLSGTVMRRHDVKRLLESWKKVKGNASAEAFGKAERTTQDDKAVD